MRLPKTEISFQHLAQLVEEYHTTCRRESNEPVGRRLVVWVVCPLEKLGGFCGYSRVQHLKPSQPVIVQSVRTHGSRQLSCAGVSVRFAFFIAVASSLQCALSKQPVTGTRLLLPVGLLEALLVRLDCVFLVDVSCSKGLGSSFRASPGTHFAQCVYWDE